MNKDEIAIKVQKLLNKDVSISNKINYFANWINDYAGRKAIIRNFDVGKDDEDVIVLVDRNKI